MPIPSWATLLSFWLHMLATVVWLGSLAAVGLLVLPTMRRSLRPAEFASWLTTLNSRLDPLGWVSIGVLTFTGLVQMEANPNYAGLFVVSNSWSQAICLKHIVFLAMVAVSAYLTWGVAPGLRRAAIKQARGHQEKFDQVWLSRFQMLVLLDLALGLLVLAFTALARIS